MIATAPTQEQVDQVARELAPDVVRIRFHIGRDWSDDPAIYFKIVLSDEASRRDRLAGVTERVRSKLDRALGLSDTDRFVYFRFRSRSEQDALREEAWE